MRAILLSSRETTTIYAPRLLRALQTSHDARLYGYQRADEQ